MLNTNLKLKKGNTILDGILNFQRSPLIKTGLVHDDNKKTHEEYATKDGEENTKIFQCSQRSHKQLKKHEMKR